MISFRITSNRTLLLATALILTTSANLDAQEVSSDEAFAVAHTFLQSQILRWTNHPELTPRSISTQSGDAEVRIDSITALKDSSDRTIAYVANLVPDGYIITTANRGLEPILGRSFSGQFPFTEEPQNALLHLIQWDMAQRAEWIEDADEPSTRVAIKGNRAKWQEYLGAKTNLIQSLATREMYPPNDSGWLDFPTWNQGDISSPSSTFNRYCPQQSSGSSSRDLVGCVATAMGQIIYYWQYPSAVTFGEADSYSSIPRFIDFDSDAATFGFPSFSSLTGMMENLLYDGSDDEFALISLAAGVKVRMNYGVLGQSWAFSHDAAAALRNGFGYSSAEAVTIPVKGAWNEDTRSRVIDNMKKIPRGWPVILGISGGVLNTTSHAIVVEGYDSAMDEFLLNFGWNGLDDTWYSLPVFETTEAIDIDWNLITTIVYDISPAAPWRGAANGDVRNTRRNPYWGPETDEVRWRANVSEHLPDAEVEHVVVGSRGDIIVFCTQSGGGGEVFIYSPEGTLLKRIDIDIPSTIELTEPIEYETNGERRYFFGIDHSIYRLDEKLGELSMIYKNDFPEDNDEVFRFPTQADDREAIYATTNHRIWKVSQVGTDLGEWKVPIGSRISSGIAVDDDRNRVYVKYYNSETDIGYLECRDGTNVTTAVWDSPLSVEGTPASSFMLGEPTIDTDGTIYAHMNNCIWAINPDGSMKWEKCLSLSAESGERIVGGFISLGVNNTILVGGLSFTASSADGWLRALDAATGDLVWEFSLPWPEFPSPAGYAFGAPVVFDGNDVLYTRFWSADPSTSTLYALRDLGDSVEVLWSFDDARWVAPTATGTAILFGPGSQEITAVGYALNPATAGMGFTNNDPPSAPSDPFPSSGSIDVEGEVELSWSSSSDPDGHDVTYTLYFGDPTLAEGAIGPIAAGLTETSYVIPALDPGHPYFWRVEATDGQDSSFSSQWYFESKAEGTSPDEDIRDYILGRRAFSVEQIEGMDHSGDGAVDVADIVFFLNQQQP